jgi:hypothetical protein
MIKCSICNGLGIYTKELGGTVQDCPRLLEHYTELKEIFRTFDLGKSQVEALEKAWKERALKAEAELRGVRDSLKEDNEKLRRLLGLGRGDVEDLIR